MKTWLFRITFVCFFIIFLFFSISCTDKSPSNQVIVVGSHWYGHIPVWIGIEKGIFKKYGFDIKWQFIGKSMDRLNAISSGEAHFASLGEIAMLSAMAQGNTRFYWVGNQDIAPGFEGLVTKEGITSFEQLKGKTIGFPFGSSVDITCRLLLKQHGLDPKKDVRLVNLEVGDVPSVFQTGRIDAAIIWEPGFSQLASIDGATVLGMDTDTEVYKKFGTMTGPDVLIINKAWSDEDRLRAKRFMKAYFESLKWVNYNSEEAVKLIQGKYINQDLSLIQKNMEKFIWHDIEDQRRIMTDNGIFGQADYIIRILHEDMKVIPNKPDFRKWVNLDILSL